MHIRFMASEYEVLVELTNDNKKTTITMARFINNYFHTSPYVKLQITIKLKYY